MHFSEFSELVHGNVSIIQGVVANVSMETKTISYHSKDSNSTGTHGLHHLDYDYLVVATGLRRAWPVVPRATEKQQYEHDAREFIAKL